MSTEAQAGHFPAADWEGGSFPYRVGHRKLGMWLFIVSDSLTFSALLIGYSYLRASNVWPTPFPFWPSIIFSSVMTFCLLSSSLTMVFGVSASSKGDKAKARKLHSFPTRRSSDLRPRGIAVGDRKSVV